MIDESFRIPRWLYDKLLPHQKKGVEFLWELHKNIGGVLADDMGLGKTVQISVFIKSLYYSSVLSTFKSHLVLLVLPVTLISNWRNELEKW